MTGKLGPLQELGRKEPRGVPIWGGRSPEVSPSGSCGPVTDGHKLSGLKSHTSALPLCGTEVHPSLSGPDGSHQPPSFPAPGRLHGLWFMTPPAPQAIKSATFLISGHSSLSCVPASTLRSLVICGLPEMSPLLVSCSAALFHLLPASSLPFCSRTSGWRSQ